MVPGGNRELVNITFAAATTDGGNPSAALTDGACALWRGLDGKRY